MTTDDWVRVALIVVAGLCVLLIGALSHQRAMENSGPQGIVRAGVMLFYLAVAFGAFVALNGWNPILRVTPPLVIALYTLYGLVLDARDELRKRPDHGPFGWVVRTFSPHKRENP